MKRRVWQGYTAHTSDTEAARLFKVKFGRAPSEIHRSKGSVLAGPLTVQEADRD